ncbi:hypothetical protein [Virgibacillus sp. Bac330]|uniref:hypothetical protein n=1 Tax=Virgibacillus sp. Bac330 TaxID=2419841 RepID=UPI000EF516CE|nr:hypothetical protein [Virgibacillus sp. Bac330]
MMKKKKIHLTNILLAIIGVSIAFLPFILKNVQEERLLNHIFVSDFQTEEKQVNDNQTTSIEEKLKLIVNHYDGNENIAIIEKSNNETKRAEYLSKGINEIKELQNKGLFPQIDMQPEFTIINSNIKTFLNTQHPQHTVTIWEAFFSTNGVEINISMDTQTNKIYEYRVNPNNNKPLSITDHDQTTTKLANYFNVKVSEKKLIDKRTEKIYTLADEDVFISFFSDRYFASFYLIPAFEAEKRPF